MSQPGLLAALYCLKRASRLSGAVIRDVMGTARPPIQTLGDLNYFLDNAKASVSRPSQSDWDTARRVVEEHEGSNVTMIGVVDPSYPFYLRTISDPPPILYLRGSISVFDRLPGAAVVGTRKASSAGIEIARRIARFLGEHGWVVVSGLALGIDASAHAGALESPTPTIAVLAHGLHMASPKANRVIAEQILERGGAWVSEHPLRVPPKPEYFVQRNRIQIGLSAGSIIVEGEEKSGTTSQAGFCVQEKRPLFAVLPGSTENSLGLVSSGPQFLVRTKGAIPIQSRADYMTVLDMLQACRQRLEGRKAA